MPQFDVHRNTGRQRETIPFVVIVQSSLYNDFRRRVVVPLVRKELLGSITDPSFNPTFTIESIDVVLHPLARLPQLNLDFANFRPFRLSNPLKNLA